MRVGVGGYRLVDRERSGCPSSELGLTAHVAKTLVASYVARLG